MGTAVLIFTFKPLTSGLFVLFDRFLTVHEHMVTAIRTTTFEEHSYAVLPTMLPPLEFIPTPAV
ncbi:hypothetical protein HISP_08660 [Haloarcula hispanica N601]|uniref:Uncharacterized protein n=2 Tax=Haloarcula hispanica TaxID=51589 RepID=V5TQV4_HALHI|nr:hypothetical protein HAH_1697 [Haloarcula hispanica ATCC 33960]AHB67488.2 hypothetical protein HISP_08660 [Haloarcula hispanica N601]